MMKKTSGLILATISGLGLSLSACGGGQEDTGLNEAANSA